MISISISRINRIFFSILLIFVVFLVYGVAGPAGDTVKKTNRANNKCPVRSRMTYTTADVTAATVPKITLTINERVLFHKYLKESTTYIEYASGMATSILACQQRSIRRIITITTDQQLVNNVTKVNTSCLYKNHRFIPHFVDIAHHLEDSQVNETVKHNLYVEAISHFQAFSPDLIFIDGRFRVHCALYALLHFQEPNVKIVFHDFYARKQNYQGLLRFADVVDCVDNLVVLQKKSTMELALLEAKLESFHDQLQKQSSL